MTVDIFHGTEFLKHKTKVQIWSELFSQLVYAHVILSLRANLATYVEQK